MQQAGMFLVLIQMIVITMHRWKFVLTLDRTRDEYTQFQENGKSSGSKSENDNRINIYCEIASFLGSKNHFFPS